MPLTNADDPLRTTDSEPCAAPRGSDVTADAAPAAPGADGGTVAYVPGQSLETMGVQPEGGPVSVS